MSANLNSALQSQEGQSENPSQDNILIRGFYSVLKLGEVYSFIETNLYSLSQILHVPQEFITITILLIIVTFAVVVYSWLRGAPTS